ARRRPVVRCPHDDLARHPGPDPRLDRLRRHAGAARARGRPGPAAARRGTGAAQPPGRPARRGDLRPGRDGCLRRAPARVRRPRGAGRGAPGEGDVDRLLRRRHRAAAGAGRAHRRRDVRPGLAGRPGTRELRGRGALPAGGRRRRDGGRDVRDGAARL
ncbi:MAG: hypothetical protein AVDCRST_MAG07-1695, partial [uncultured Frankineae bacterium]